MLVVARLEPAQEIRIAHAFAADRLGHARRGVLVTQVDAGRVRLAGDDALLGGQVHAGAPGAVDVEDLDADVGARGDLVAELLQAIGELLRHLHRIVVAVAGVGKAIGIAVGHGDRRLRAERGGAKQQNGETLRMHASLHDQSSFDNSSRATFAVSGK